MKQIFHALGVLILAFVVFTVGYGTAEGAVINKPSNYLTLNSGLVGWWTMDGKDVNWATGAVTDKSGQGGTGQVVGMSTSTSITNGKFGQAFYMDGSDDYVNMAGFTGVNGLSRVSVSMWVKKDNLNNNSFMSQWNSGRLFDFSNSGSTLNINWRYGGSGGTGSTLQQTIANGIVANEWRHYVIVYDDPTASAYCNGQSCGTPTSGTGGALNTNVTDPLRIGWNNLPAYYKGSIDDVRIYNRALSADEIRLLYNQGAGSKLDASQRRTSDSLANGLVGWWTMDGNKMISNVSDSSGNGRNGYLVGYTSTTTMPGKIGQALLFDGVDDRVNLGATDIIGTGDVTLTAWVYRKTGDGTGRVLGNNRYVFVTNTVGRMVLKSDGVESAQTSNNCTAYDKWTFLAVTRASDGTAHIYCDNVLFNGSDLTSGTPAAGNENVTIGNRQAGSEPWFGGIDDVRLYDRILSISEIRLLYNQGLSKFGTSIRGQDNLQNGLIGHWTFDGKDVNWGTNQVIDRSGQGNTGTVTGISTSTGPVEGTIGQAMRFSGSNSINIPYQAVLNAQNAVTFVFWMRPLQNVTDSTANGVVTKNASTDYRLRPINPNRFTWFQGGSEFSSNNNIYSPNVWTQIAIVHDSSGGRFYRNGVAWGSDVVAYVAPSSSADLYFMPTVPMDLDDMRMYNRALSVDELRQLYYQYAPR